MSVTVHQVTNLDRTDPNGQVTAVVDRRWHDFLTGGQTGVATGCTVTALSGLQIQIQSGWGIIMGCLFTIAAETITVTASTGGSVNGRLLLQIDTATSTGSLITQAATPLPALTQEDINTSGTIYQLPLATYTVNELAVTDLSFVAPTVSAAAQKLATARTIQTNLASGSAASFDGTANVTPGVTGVLPVANGGTGASSVADVRAGKDANGNAIAATYMPIAGGTFTGLAYANNASTLALCLRNSQVQNSAGVIVNSQYLIFRRK